MYKLNYSDKTLYFNENAFFLCESNEEYMTARKLPSEEALSLTRSSGGLEGMEEVAEDTPIVYALSLLATSTHLTTLRIVRKLELSIDLADLRLSMDGSDIHIYKHNSSKPLATFRHSASTLFVAGENIPEGFYNID
jgi:hypothetical protein